jgi:hypothetical protein
MVDGNENSSRAFNAENYPIPKKLGL